MNSKVKIIIIVVVAIVLIFSIVNSLTGENGYFAKRREEKALIELSRVMKEIEDNIGNINASNSGKSISSAEMLKALEEKGLIKLNNKGVMQGTVISDKIDNLIIGYNGDVYLNNYKRASVPLSTVVSSKEYSNPFNHNQKQVVKVIDGEIVEENGNCWICSMIGRNDFACWINESGEMVSIEKNMPFSYEAQDAEYIALYNEDLKMKFANKYVINTTSNAYVENDKILFNIMSYNYYQRSIKENYIYDKESNNYLNAYIGKTLINSYGVYFSDESDLLLNLKNENLQSGKHIASYGLSDLAELDEKNYSNGLRLSILNCELNATEIKSKLESAWGKEIKRLYYRAGVDANYYQREQDTDLTEEEKLNFCLEPAIKYIEFE